MEDTPYIDLDPMDWNPKHVESFLKANQKKYSLRDKYIQVLVDEEVSGRVFLKLTEENLRGNPFNLTFEAVRTFVKIIDTLKNITNILC